MITCICLEHKMFWANILSYPHCLLLPPCVISEEVLQLYGTIEFKWTLDLETAWVKGALLELSIEILLCILCVYVIKFIHCYAL